MQSGRQPDVIGKLAPITSYELMLRSLVDQKTTRGRSDEAGTFLT